MRIELNEQDATPLRTMLRDYLPALQREPADTDARDFRWHLGRRVELCERLLAELGDREIERGSVKELP